MGGFDCCLFGGREELGDRRWTWVVGPKRCELGEGSLEIGSTSCTCLLASRFLSGSGIRHLGCRMQLFGN